MTANESITMSFKTEFKNTLALIVVALLIFTSIITIKDFVTFQNITSAQYKTPWYTNSFMKEPYTTVRLSLADKVNVKEYWTKNAIGSQDWFVREVKVGETTFWTLLERNEINP
jgi:ABC-type microcin C transport system permease subunit YejE